MNAYIYKEDGYDVMGVQGAAIFKPFTNFAEVDGKGNHHFNIEVEPEFVELMKQFGFEPKFLDGQDGKYREHWIIDAVIGYKKGDPGVTTVAYNGVKSPLTENELGDLDRVSISFVDMTLTRNFWEVNGRKGVKPWAKNLYFYLSGPSFAEQRYQERFGNVQQPELPGMPQPALVNDEDDIPF